MSIQERISSKRGQSALLLQSIRGLSLAKQVMSRFSCGEDMQVYYPYRNPLHTHPFFSRYYNYPPLSYCNVFRPELCHWVNSMPKWMSHVDYVIEPNDHPLAATAKSEPCDVLNGIEKAVEVYSNERCKKILVEGEGQLDMFKRYLPELVTKKTKIVRLGAIPQLVDFDQKMKSVETPIFLCLASDYKKKAIDILIQAWREFSQKSKCQLILACPNVPIEIANTFDTENIRLIRKAPLSEDDKKELLSIAHVMVAPLHVDGGSNIIEAFEYGLPVITMRSQRSFIRGGNGWEVDTPFYFYDEGYGKEWPTWNRFWQLMDAAKSEKMFDVTVQGFVNVFEDIANTPSRLIEMGQASHKLAKEEFSLGVRNATLRQIYLEALR